MATPDITATISRPGRAPPPTRSITSRSGVPSSTSATPARTVSPLTVHTTVPGESAVPSSRNQSAPKRTIPGRLAYVSTLLASVGGATASADGPAISTRAAERAAGVDVGLLLEHLVDALPVGRGQTGERGTAVDHLEQPGLLAEQVLLGSGDERDRHGGGPAFGVDLGDGGLQPGDLPVERGLGGDDHRVGAHRMGGDERTLEHAVRVAAEDLAVLEAAGLALGRVHDHGGSQHRGRVGDDRLPLARGREARAAPAAQAGRTHQLDDGAGVDGPGVREPVTGAVGPCRRRGRVSARSGSTRGEVRWFHPTGLYPIPRQACNATGIDRRLSGASGPFDASRDLPAGGVDPGRRHCADRSRRPPDRARNRVTCASTTGSAFSSECPRHAVSTLRAPGSSALARGTIASSHGDHHAPYRVGTRRA